MKKILFAILIIFSVSSFTFGQNNAVKIGTSAFVYGNSLDLMFTPLVYGLSFETTLSERATTEIEFNYLHQNMNTIGSDGFGKDFRYNGFGFTYDIKYNVFVHKMNTIYISPYYRLLKVNTVEINKRDDHSGSTIVEEHYGNVSFFDIGAKVGFKCLVLKRFLLDISLGSQVSYYTYDLSHPFFFSMPEELQGGIISGIRPNLKVGYAF